MRIYGMSCRSFMTAVTIAAPMLWGSSLQDRSRHCRSAIWFHALEAQAEMEFAEREPVHEVCGVYWDSMTPQQKRKYVASLPTRDEYRATCLRRAEYHRQAEAKFKRASWRPWEPLPDIPPDPPRL